MNETQALRFAPSSPPPGAGVYHPCSKDPTRIRSHFLSRAWSSVDCALTPQSWDHFPLTAGFQAWPLQVCKRWQQPLPGPLVLVHPGSEQEIEATLRVNQKIVLHLEGCAVTDLGTGKPGIAWPWTWLTATGFSSPGWEKADLWRPSRAQMLVQVKDAVCFFRAEVSPGPEFGQGHCLQMESPGSIQMQHGRKSYHQPQCHIPGGEAEGGGVLMWSVGVPYGTAGEVTV